MEESPRDRAGKHAGEDVSTDVGQQVEPGTKALKGARGSEQRPSFRHRIKATWKRLRGGELTPTRAAASVAIGLLIGSTPLYGLHFVLVVAVCLPLKLDVPVAYLAANISNPFMAPFLSFAEVETGSLVRTGAWRALSVDAIRRDGIWPFLTDAIIGVIVFAPALAVVGGSITLAIAKIGQRLRASKVVTDG